MSVSTHDTATITEPSRTVLCPGCGYDLRAATGDRCSECGLVLDRESLKRSGFPWAHRAGVGRVRAFLKTVWLVIADSSRIRQEAAKAQSARDAAVFRRWVAAVLAVSFAAVVVVLIESGAILHAVVQAPSSFAIAGPSRWRQDLMVPWSAGVTLRPMLFVYAVALAIYAAGATRPIFRTRGLPPDYAEAVEAISGYVVAPLVLLGPATAFYGLYWWLEVHEENLIRATWVGPVLPIVTGLFAVVAIAGTVYRTGQWRARTAHGGYPTGFMAMGELLLRWAVGGAVFAAVVPWCVGFVWVLVDSFRG